MPTYIENRLSNLLSNEKLFQESAPHYEDNLRLSGYNKKLTHKPTYINQLKYSNHDKKDI